MQSERQRLAKIFLAFAAIYLIWGTTYLGIRLALEAFPPFLMAGTRFLLAGLIIYAWLRIRGAQRPHTSQWSAALIIGLLMVAGGSGLLHWAEQTIPSGIAALIIATIPLWITFFDWIMFRRDKPSKRVVGGLVLGFIGIILLIGPDQLAGTASFSWVAVFILLLSPIFWSLGSLYSRQANLPENAFMVSGMEMVSGGVVLLLAGLLSGEVGELDLSGVSPLSWLALLYLLFFGSITAYSAYTYLLKTVSAAKASTYSYVNPVIAVYLGWLVLAEPVSPATVAAMAIIVIAVVLITSSPAPRPAEDIGQDPRTAKQ